MGIKSCIDAKKEKYFKFIMMKYIAENEKTLHYKLMNTYLDSPMVVGRCVILLFLKSSHLRRGIHMKISSGKHVNELPSKYKNCKKTY